MCTVIHSAIIWQSDTLTAIFYETNSGFRRMQVPILVYLCVIWLHQDICPCTAQTHVSGRLMLHWYSTSNEGYVPQERFMIKNHQDYAYKQREISTASPLKIKSSLLNLTHAWRRWDTRTLREICNYSTSWSMRNTYLMDSPPLSEVDCATDNQKQECSKNLHRRVVGQLIHSMVQTMITIMYALNVLYGNNPGPGHIEFMKHLVKYCKYGKLDKLKFYTHDGLTDMMFVQLRFQCDVDLERISCVGYLGESVIWSSSTEQGSVSTVTTQSEISAVNQTFKVEVISHPGILSYSSSSTTIPIQCETNCAIQN